MTIVETYLPDGPTDGNRQFTVLISPTVEPITATELKLFGRIDGTDEDDLIDGFISAARTACEGYLSRALIKQKIRLSLDYWPGMEIELPRPPLISVEGVYTLDEDDNPTTYDATSYFIIKNNDPAKIVIRNGCSPPTNTSRFYSGFVVDMWAGYGDAATYVPQPIKEGLKLWVMQIYEQRNMTPEPPPEAKILLEQFVLSRY